jgi:diguanylate cyclase (GGDEF)-like protein
VEHAALGAPAGRRRRHPALREPHGQLGSQRSHAPEPRVPRLSGAAARESDITGRWGGDEFVILGIGDRSDEHEFELRILAGIDADDALLTARWTPGVTVGVAASGADVGEGMALVSDADHRMYARRRLRRT